MKLECNSLAHGTRWHQEWTCVDIMCVPVPCSQAYASGPATEYTVQSLLKKGDLACMHLSCSSSYCVSDLGSDPFKLNQGQAASAHDPMHALACLLQGLCAFCRACCAYCRACVPTACLLQSLSWSYPAMSLETSFVRGCPASPQQKAKQARSVVQRHVTWWHRQVPWLCYRLMSKHLTAAARYVCW